VSSPAARADSKLQVIPVRMYKYSLLLLQLEQRLSKNLSLLVEFLAVVWTSGNTAVLPAQTDCFVTNN